LTEWQVYAAQYGPLDAQARADLRLGIMAALTAEIHRDPEKRKEPYTPEDFMPKWGGAAEDASTKDEQSPEQMLAMVVMLNAAFGGKDLRRGNAG
jgi:hypothetical protein